MWDVPCWSDRILVGGISFWAYTLFNFLNFDWQVCYGVASIHSPGFGFTIAYWQSRLEFVYSVCFLSGDWLKFERHCRGKRGMISKWELVRVCCLCVMCKFFFMAF